MKRCVHCGGPTDEEFVHTKAAGKHLGHAPVCEVHVAVTRANLEAQGLIVYGLTDCGPSC